MNYSINYLTPNEQGFALLNSVAAKVTPGFDPWAVTVGVRTSF
ncbi:hypothetical protein OKW30_007837 [Paraburkholderia sp. Clong3]|nr:hypothetical protein [Paraburkholderia tuberum]